MSSVEPEKAMDNYNNTKLGKQESLNAEDMWGQAGMEPRPINMGRRLDGSESHGKSWMIEPD